MRFERQSGPPTRSALRFAAVLALLMLFAARARASENGPWRLVLDYRVHAGCPNEAAFRAQVQRRLLGVRPRDEPVTVHVAITRHGGKSTGVLQFGADKTSRRSVSDPVCANVVQALALIVAVDLGGDASPEPAQPQRAHPRPAPRPAARPPSPAQASKVHVVPMLGVDLVAATPIARGLVLGPAAFVGARLETGRPLAWALRATVAHASTGIVSSGAGAAHFSWTAARLDGCASLTPFRSIQLEPCITSHVGVLDAAGIPTPEIQHTRTASSLWLSAGVLARLRVLVLPALALEAQGSLEASVRRRQFVFQTPNSDIYRTPLFGVFAGAGIAAQLP